MIADANSTITPSQILSTRLNRNIDAQPGASRTTPGWDVGMKLICTLKR